MGRPGTDELAASLAATWALARSGGAVSVDDLAAAAGLSRRTFHRLFPRKEDCLRPALADARSLMFAQLADDASTPLVAAYLTAFGTAAAGAFADRTRLLMPVVMRDAHLQAVWDHEVTVGIGDLAEVLRRRGDVHRALDAEVLATALLAITARALTASADGGDPVEILSARLESLFSLGVIPAPCPAPSGAHPGKVSE